MRRNCRLILKWLLLIGFFVFLFEMCCNSLVNYILSTTRSSLDSVERRNAIQSYEESLIAWAATGQRSKNGKLIMKSVQERTDLHRIGAQIFFRHGARTPLNLLPSLEEVIYGKDHIESYLPTKWEVKLIAKRDDQIVPRENISSYNDIDGERTQKLKAIAGHTVRAGQLTAVGEKQLFQLGRLIRSRLIDSTNNRGPLSATYDPKYVYCRSTFFDRTIASARSFLAGLFSSDQSSSTVQANGPFEIEVHHFPDEVMFPNPRLHPILKRCPSAVSLYQSLNDEHELKKARQALIHRIGATEYTEGIIELYDDIVSRLAHNFSVPADILDLAKDFEVMSAREYVYRATDIGFDQFIRASCGTLLSLIRANFESILKNYLEETNTKIKKPYHKLFVYSGHDTTLIPLALAFEIFDMRWPKYAAYIFFEYFVSKTNPEETYVTVNFAGQPQILPNCHDYYCAYSTFLKNLQNRFHQPGKST